MLIREIILNKLRQVKPAGMDKDIVAAGMVHWIDIEQNIMNLILNLKEELLEERENITKQVRSALEDHDADFEINVIIESHTPVLARPVKTTIKHKIGVVCSQPGVEKTMVALNLGIALSKQGIYLGIG